MVALGGMQENRCRDPRFPVRQREPQATAMRHDAPLRAERERAVVNAASLDMGRCGDPCLSVGWLAALSKFGARWLSCLHGRVGRGILMSRRGAGVADRGSLENCCTCKRTVGSNPTLSAKAPAARAVFPPTGHTQDILASFRKDFV